MFNARNLRRADGVVAIRESMRARLPGKGASAGAIRVISNWADTDLLEPGCGKEGALAQYAALLEEIGGQPPEQGVKGSSPP